MTAPEQDHSPEPVSHHTQPLLFDDEFLEAVPEPVDPGEEAIAFLRDRLLKDLRAHDEKGPRFKSRVYLYGKLVRLSVFFEVYAKHIQSYKFSLEQLNALREELRAEGYAVGKTPSLIGEEVTRRIVSK